MEIELNKYRHIGNGANTRDRENKNMVRYVQGMGGVANTREQKMEMGFGRSWGVGGATNTNKVEL